jgi:hypothetical protein
MERALPLDTRPQLGGLPMPKINVFVSHVTVEARFADLLRDRLSRDFIGLLDMFISTDATSIPVGTHWFDRLLDAIRDARLQFVLCSPDSVRLPWINYESGAARIRGVEIIPLCHSGIRPEQLPVPLSMSEGLVLTDPAGLRKLYARIADLLSADVPDVAFDAYAAQFRALEDEYARQRNEDATASRNPTEEGIVEDPTVVCVSSPQFIELGYKNQLDMVMEAFPPKIQHRVVITADDLQDVLLAERVDILHVATYVCPRTGVLYFSPVDLPSGRAVGDKLEIVRPEALAMLLKTAQTRLVVIAGAHSLALVTHLLTVTNVITPREIVSARALAVWVEEFYDTLRVTSLAEACEYAGNASQVSMRLLTQQVNVPEITFRRRPHGS